MATQPRLVNKQFNTPINLYSRQNVQEVLDRETQILANGAIGIDFRNNPTVDKPGNLKNSAVLRMLEEEENRQRNGFGPGNEVARPLRENITWPPPEYEHKNQLRSTFKDVVTTGSKRVAWPPPNESGLDGLEPENNQQLHKGAPQYSTTAQSPPSPNNQRHPIQNQPARAPLRPLDVSQRDASPLASPLANQSPRGWAPVHSPTHFQTAHQPVTQQTFLGQQYQPSAQKYQAPPPAQQPYQAPPTQQFQAPPLAQQQYQAAPAQQYQAPPPAQQQYQAPPPTQQRYQAAPSPAQQYQVPPTQPPYQASPAQQQYQASPPVQQYKAAPSSPQQYRPVSQQSSETYQVSSQQYQTGPSQQYQQSHQSQTSYQTSSQQYQVSTQYNVSQQAPQVSRQVSSSTSAQVTPQSRPVVEPPPSTITLRPQPPINQAPPPLITSQPATATLKGGKHLRGDLKWPPENVKKQFEEENKMRLELARGPVFRPKKPNKDYSEFFEQHRLNSTYPGYKIPPGTQFYRPA